jgi:UDP-glucose 4-epimerase
LKLLQYSQLASVTFTQRRKWDTKPRLLASVARAQSLIGYHPNTPFPEGLKQAVAWFKDNWDLIAAAARFGPGMSSAVRQLVCKG